MSALDEVAHEEALLEMWMSGVSPGLTALERGKLLGKLLALRGERERGLKRLETLEGVSTAAAVIEQEALRTQLR
jgi:hypothetical protein